MPWVPIKNFDEDVIVGDIIKCGECEPFGPITAIGKKRFLGGTEKEEASLEKIYVTHVWREPERWIAQPGEEFFHLDELLSVKQATATCAKPGAGTRLLWQNYLYQMGNYFKTKEQAEKAVQKIKEVLAKFHEEEEGK